MFIISFIGAILPAWFLVKYFTEADQFPEPPDVIKSTFWGGVKTVFWVLLTVGPLMFVLESVLVDLPVVLAAGVQAFLFAAIPEEFFKFRVLQKVSTHKAFDEPMDGIVYGAVASLGFATLENIMYCMDGELSTVLMRAITAVPAHASFGAIMGYYFSKQHFKGEKVGVLGIPYLLPMLCHGFYDYFLFVTAGLGAKGEDMTDSEAMLVVASMLAFFALGTWMFRTVRSMVSEMRTEQERLIASQPIA